MVVLDDIIQFIDALGKDCLSPAEQQPRKTTTDPWPASTGEVLRIDPQNHMAGELGPEQSRL
jgi:hypothetical protein